MNKIVKGYLKRIEAATEDLAERLEDLRAQRDHQQEAREKLLKEFWVRGKRLSQLEEATKTLPDIEKRLSSGDQIQAEIRAGLEQLVKKLQLLRDEFQAP